MSFVSDLTILLLEKNSFKTTFKEVYIGMAIIIPTAPNKVPEAIMIMKISNGCDFTLFEKING